MGDISAPIQMIRGLPVVRAPAEIDATSAEQLRAVLLTAATGGHVTVVVDMTCTRFCDSAGLSVLLRAHRRAVAEGGEVRLVIPAGGIVFRVFSLTGLNWLIPWFNSLDEALIQTPPAAVVPLRPRPRVGAGLRGSRPDPIGRPELVAAAEVAAYVTEQARSAAGEWRCDRWAW